MYPNPSKEYSKITSNEMIYSVNIFNTIGQKIKSFENINSNEFEINTSNFSNGLYMIVINKTISKKLIIE
ncbi:T9SS type A sorting domain-containing protein [uncultured Flavobacterium sp.]|uniref:T9SS type A sorting domain-containing protein n=1 Tax=uncultured Flavobacterium sp. TaxID=165435 RepID=UPI0030EC9F83